MTQMVDMRGFIVRVAREWGIANEKNIHYTEGGQRAMAQAHPFTLPMSADCSEFIYDIYEWCGCPISRNSGYTGTELQAGKVIPLAQVEPGDAIVYGPGTGEHTALVVETGNDPLTVSHGQESGPQYVRVSQDGRQPQRYLRFNTAAPVLVGAHIVKNPIPNGGDWFVYQGKKSGIPNGLAEEILVARGATPETLNAAQLKALPTIAYGAV